MHGSEGLNSWYGRCTKKTTSPTLQRKPLERRDDDQVMSLSRMSLIQKVNPPERSGMWLPTSQEYIDAQKINRKVPSSHRNWCLRELLMKSDVLRRWVPPHVFAVFDVFLRMPPKYGIRKTNDGKRGFLKLAKWKRKIMSPYHVFILLSLSRGHKTFAFVFQHLDISNLCPTPYLSVWMSVEITLATDWIEGDWPYVSLSYIF